MRLLLIGQAPSKETEGKPVFSGKSGALLASLMGTTQDQMLADHDFINILDHWPGKGIGGDKFPLPEAIASVRNILPTLKGRTVVLLGSNVARAFGCKAFRYLELYRVVDPNDSSQTIAETMTVVPHPSGVNRWYNKPENRVAVGKFFAGLLSEKP